MSGLRTERTASLEMVTVADAVGLLTERTASMELVTDKTASAALATSRARVVVAYGFESGEAWGSFDGASISTARAHSGVQSLKIAKLAGGSATLLLTAPNDIGPMEGKTCSVWIYIETVGINSAILITFSAVGRVVSFSELFNLQGLPLNVWTKLFIDQQAPVGPLTNLTQLRISTSGGPAAVVYVDDIELGPAGPLVTERTASLELATAMTASAALVTSVDALHHLRTERTASLELRTVTT